MITRNSTSQQPSEYHSSGGGGTTPIWTDTLLIDMTLTMALNNVLIKKAETKTGCRVGLCHSSLPLPFVPLTHRGQEQEMSQYKSHSQPPLELLVSVSKQPMFVLFSTRDVSNVGRGRKQIRINPIRNVKNSWEKTKNDLWLCL